MIRGKIIKGIGGFYYVKTLKGIYECKARGLFRNTAESPIVGDNCILEETEQMRGYIVEILPRKNLFLRPPVANVDKAFIVFSINDPDIDLSLLDKMIVQSYYYDTKPIVLINKSELNRQWADKLILDYRKSDIEAYAISVYEDSDLTFIYDKFKGYTSALMGPSGVGKSTLLNQFVDNKLQTGEISEKTKRGKHTTRHVELLILDNETFVFDTPGYSSLELEFIDDAEELKYYYPDFYNLSENCKFNNCLHDREPNCAVKMAVEQEKIAKWRYENYKNYLEAIRNKRRY
ncbi:MAG: ribosome small subunit-dependent GTPase A [Tissierellia bacterium]|nr:ribosome small subunit-dependent GTPase A [Tissierellia bacterium]